MGNIVFANVGDGKTCGVPVGILYRDDVACLKALPLGQLLGNNHRALAQLYRAAAIPVAECKVIVHRRRICGYGDVQVVCRCIAFGHHRHILLGHGQVTRDAGGVVQQCLQLFALGGAFILNRHHQLIVRQIVKLFFHNVRDRIPHTEARHQQGGAARNAHHCHEKALFIQEQVAGRYLMGKTHAPPDGADMLQQNALARFRRLWQHQAGGLFTQFGPAGIQGGQQGAGNRSARGNGAEKRVERRFQNRQVVHDIVGI